MGQSLWKIMWHFLSEGKMHLAYNPAIIVLGIYPTHVKTYSHSETSTEVFVVALFVIKTRNYLNIFQWLDFKHIVVRPDHGL